MKSILVIQTAFIGDAILASSILEALHQAVPDGYKIDLLVRKGNETLYENHPYLNRVLIWDKKKRKYLNLIRLIRQIRTNRYDTVINLQRFFATGLLTALSGAKQRIGFKKNPLSLFFTVRKPHRIAKGIHEVDRNHSLIEDMVDCGRTLPKLYVNETQWRNIEPYLHSLFVTIAPASVWFTKQFPKHKWVEVLKGLPSHLRIIALGSNNDRNLCQEILNEACRESALNLCGELSLLDSAALMSKAVMNFVNDSAPLHLASAVDAPVTVLFCSTIRDFGFWPLSSKSFVIETQEQLACRPCGLHGFTKCPEKHFRCAETIHPNQFKDIFESL